MNNLHTLNITHSRGVACHQAGYRHGSFSVNDDISGEYGFIGKKSNKNHLYCVDNGKDLFLTNEEFEQAKSNEGFVCNRFHFDT